MMASAYAVAPERKEISVATTIGAVERGLIKYPAPGIKPPASWNSVARVLSKAMVVIVMVWFLLRRANNDVNSIFGSGFAQ